MHGGQLSPAAHSSGAGRIEALEGGTDMPGHPIQLVTCNGVLLAWIEVSLRLERDEVNVRVRDSVAFYGDSNAISARSLLERKCQMSSAIPQAPVARWLQVEEIVDVLARDEQQVTGMDGLMVQEANEFRALPYDCRRSPPRHDLAEDTTCRFHVEQKPSS
jgi:hypothetical protein